VRHLYHLSYNIWESIIRDAMQKEIIAVTPELIARFLTPVITDHNNNLLHHISYNRIDQLQEIIAMPGFAEYYSVEKKMFPIFYNFFGET